MDKWKHMADKYAYSYFGTLMLSFGILGLFMDYYEIPVKPYLYILILVAEIIYIEAIGTNIKRSLLYGIAVILILGLIFYLTVGKTAFYKEIISYGRWLVSVVQLEEIKEGWHGYITVIAGGLLVGTFAFFVQRYHVIQNISFLVCSIFPFLLLATNTKTGKFTLIGIMGYAISGWIHIAVQKKGNALAVTYLLPIILFISLTLFVLPVKEEPINWAVFKRAAERFVEKAEHLIIQIRIRLDKEQEDFSISFSGYSESGKIGGSIQENSNTILLVKTNRTKSPAAYLTGNMKNVYTKDGWEEDYEDVTYLGSDQYTENQIDLWEFMYGLYKTGRIEDHNTYFSLRELNITYQDIYTKSLFAPLKTTKISMSPPAAIYQYQQKGYTFLEMTGEDMMYRVQYMYLNLNSTYMEEFIKEREGAVYGGENPTAEEVKKLRKTFSFLSEKAGKEIETILKAREDYIEETYMSLPDSLPDRVKELAETITKDADSDYEKMKALEQYVSSYAYTTRPKDTPKGQDVVDYFLFDSMEGYCTYHASALAVLARCIGIPSRYVQGFCVQFEQDGNLETNAVGTMAHAWCECYIKGVGWLPFEATPSYGECRYQPWEKKVEKKQTNRVEEEPEEEKTEEYHVPELPVEEEIKEEAYDDSAVWRLIKKVLVLTAALIIVWLLIRFTRYDRHYRRNTIDGRYELTILFWYHLLEEFGVKLEEGESFTHFMERAKCYGNAEAAEKLKDDYLRYRYDEGEVTKEMLHNVRVLQKQLKELLIHRKGVLKGEITFLRIKLFINS